jgi:hypothetical protein
MAPPLSVYTLRLHYHLVVRIITILISLLLLTSKLITVPCSMSHMTTLLNVIVEHSARDVAYVRAASLKQ